MKYEEAIEMYSKGKASYEETVERLKRVFIENVKECPWDNRKEEGEKLYRAKGLLEELRFIKMYLS